MEIYNMSNKKNPVQADKTMHRALNILPVFTAKEIRTGVTTLLAKDCVAFIVHTSCDYQINGLGPAAALSPGSSVRGMPIGADHVLFNTPVTVEIM